MIDRLDRLLAVCAGAFAWIGGGLVLVIAVLVTGDVIFRNLTGATPFQAFELSAYLFAAAIAFGFSHTLAVGGNIRLDVVYGLFPVAMRRAVDLAALVAMALVGGMFAQVAWRLTLANNARGVTSATGLAVPLALPQAIWATGLSVFALTAVWLVLRHGAALLRRDWALADSVGAIGGLPEADVPPDAAGGRVG